MNPKLKAYLQIHIATLLYGLTAILGDLIDLSAIVLVWWRVLITSISLLFFIQFGKTLLKLPRKTLVNFILIGFLVGFHWICFYGSIKLANASVALVAMATSTFFTSIFEPIILKRKFDWLEFGFSAAIIPGMLFIANQLDLSMINGLLVGLLAAALASSFAILTKKYFDDAEPFQITFLQIFGAFLLLSMVMPFYFNSWGLTNGLQPQFLPSNTDWVYLIILSLLCTTLAYYLGVICLKYLSAFETTLVINLEPVYGILLAIAILGDHKELSSHFYIGVFIILVVVFTFPFIKKMRA